MPRYERLIPVCWQVVPPGGVYPEEAGQPPAAALHDQVRRVQAVPLGHRLPPLLLPHLGHHVNLADCFLRCFYIYSSGFNIIINLMY